MKLVVHELRTTLVQKLTVGTSNVAVDDVRPHIFKYGTPAGSLFMSIQDSTGVTTYNTSTAVTIASITSASNTYFHGYVDFVCPVILLAGVTYRFVLSSTGYTFAETGYIGWANDFDLRKYSLGYTQVGGTIMSPLDTEVWPTKPVAKGTYP